MRPQVFSGTNPASAALASGDIAVLFNASETGLMPLQSAGAPLRWTFPEPAAGPVTGQAISARAPHPNAAKLYHEYAFTTEGYGCLAEARRRTGAHRLPGPAADRVAALVQISDEVSELRRARRDDALPESFGTCSGSG